MVAVGDDFTYGNGSILRGLVPLAKPVGIGSQGNFDTATGCRSIKTPLVPLITLFF